MSFDDLSIAYDNSINWDTRLKRELPYLLSLLPEKGRVLDVACGTGRHSIEIASKGHNVTGFDSSENMIHYAKKLALEQDLPIEFFVADMMDISNIAGLEVDLIFCLGNSFALLRSFENLESVFASLPPLLSKNGRLVFQVLNFEEILTSGFRYFPLKGGTTLNGSQVIFSRFYEHYPEKKFSILVATSFLKQDGKWFTDISTHKVLHLNDKRVRTLLSSAGFEDIEILSNYSGDPFSSTNSRNMVVTASLC
jgi:ubiquinone/menaquinone biosynthesis C-methylase UbiE